MHPVPPKANAVKLNFINTKIYDSIRINGFKLDEIILNIKSQDDKNQYTKADDFWSKNRLDTLSFHEKAIYQMIDTLKTNRRLNYSAKVIAFIGTGLWDLKDKIPEPELFPYLIHVVKWPIPRGYRPQLQETGVCGG